MDWLISVLLQLTENIKIHRITGEHQEATISDSLSLSHAQKTTIHKRADKMAKIITTSTQLVPGEQNSEEHSTSNGRVYVDQQSKWKYPSNDPVRKKARSQSPWCDFLLCAGTLSVHSHLYTPTCLSGCHGTAQTRPERQLIRQPLKYTHSLPVAPTC